MSISIKDRTGFEIFLEGIKISSWSSISIQEVEGQFPQANISLGATNNNLRTLPGTVVQIFGPHEDQIILLFEGEVQGISYQKGPSGRISTLTCASSLSNFDKASIRPKDALVSTQRTENEGSYTGGQDYYVVSNPSVGSGQSNKELIDSVGDVEDSVINQLLNNIEISGYSPFLTTFIQLLSTENNSEESNLVGNGEYHYLIQYFFQYFEQTNPYFGLISNSLDLKNSIFSWPNSGRTTPFKNRLILDQGLQLMSSVSNQKSATDVYLKDALSMFKSIVDYTMISPSSPTQSQRFWNGNSDGPVRAHYLPSLDNSPPILCNVFFPHQVSSFNYQRSMMREPTRVIGAAQIPLVTDEYLERGVTPMYVAPDLKIDQESVDGNTIGMTTEETYRGINSIYTSLDSRMSLSLRGAIKEGSNNDNPEIELNKEMFKFNSTTQVPGLEGFSNSMQQMVYSQYLKGKYGGRICNVSVDWNPNRVVGLPTLILEEEAPSIHGVINSISTTIDANGSTSSTISIRNPRLIYTDKSVFNQENEEDVINDFTSDGIKDINYFLFDPNLYNFTNVGADVYNYIMYGQGSENGNFLSSDSPSTGFEKFESEIDSMSKSLSADGSILRYIRDEDGDIVSELSKDTDSPEVFYSKLLVEATRKVKSLYNELKSNGKDDFLETQLDSIIGRSLTTKIEYFNSIGVTLNSTLDQALLENYVDSEKFFKGLKNTKNLKEIISRSSNRQRTAKKLNNLQIQIDKLNRKISETQSVYDKYNSGSLRFKQFRNWIVEQDIENSSTNYTKLYEELNNTSNVITSLLDRLSNERKELQDSVETIIDSDSQTESLEKEVIKAYNIIRRSHVELAYMDDITSVDNIKVIN